MDTLLRHLDAWRPFRALVVGDFMLDELVYGDAERLSADAPVPVLLVRRVERNPGGAASLALDLAAMQGSVAVFGVTGDDAEGRALREALRRTGVETDGLIADPTRPTTLKRNLVGLAQQRHPQKMFRVDHESREPLGSDARRRLLAAFDAALASVDVVCIEDYDKGVCDEALCREVIRRAVASGVPVFVDPARIADYSKYAGATAITPNRNEAEFATGFPTDGAASPGQCVHLAHGLLGRLSCEAVVLTLDRQGALLLERDAPPLSVPTLARQVYDVTGAGDMFLAALAAARANGCSWPDAVRFANAAAGLEVEVFGTQPIPLRRIHHELLLRAGALVGKARSLEQVAVEVAARRDQGQTIVFTNGCFDVLHAGHVTLLDRAAEMGDFLIVGLNDDESVRRLKGEGRPVNGQDDRARVLGALAAVGAVVLFGEDTPMRLIETIRPDVLVKGADWGRDGVVGREFVESIGGRVELVDLVEGRSTTATLDRIRGRAG